MKEMKTDASIRLGDLTSIRIDISEMAWTCEKIPLLLGSTEVDKILQYRRYVDSLLISYRRCFDTGVRESLTKHVFDAVDGDIRQTHNLFYKLGDFVAHNVSPYEQMKSGIYLEGDSVGVGSVVAKALPLDAKNCRDMLIILSNIRKWLDREILDCQTQLRKEARALSAEEYSELPNLTIHYASADDAQKARSGKFRQ